MGRPASGTCRSRLGIVDPHLGGARCQATASLIIVLVLMGLGVVQAQRQTTSEQLTVSTSAVGITAAVIQPAGRAVPNNTCTVFVEAANIRFQWDGTAPTTTLGDIGYVGATIRIDNTEFMRSMRFIRDDAVNATLNIQCWLEPSS